MFLVLFCFRVSVHVRSVSINGKSVIHTETLHFSVTHLLCQSQSISIIRDFYSIVQCCSLWLYCFLKGLERVTWTLTFLLSRRVTARVVIATRTTSASSAVPWPLPLLALMLVSCWRKIERTLVQVQSDLTGRDMITWLVNRMSSVKKWCVWENCRMVLRSIYWVDLWLSMLFETKESYNHSSCVQRSV